MVIVCDQEYPSSSEELYSKHFEKYPFPLSNFQKFGIEAILTGNHVLSCVPTGSGKTLCAEFAIEHFSQQLTNKKRVIYTSPIKALSNQKYHEFSKKFPNISFGIITGDIKANPEADVLIMTTEILLNSLYANNSKNTNNLLSMFEMNFNTELACVIFDEVHMIGDANRGHVWEETIMMLPTHIQMIMLSATLYNPEKFAAWCETRGQTNTTDKQVFLSCATKRNVPLTHYSFITCNQGLFKKIKDKSVEDFIKHNINKLHTIQDANGKFNNDNYLKIKKINDITNKYQHHVKRSHVLNTVANHLVTNNMLPAICFVLSRKKLEQCANELTTVLLEDDSKLPYIIKNECEQFIRKLPNYDEYLNLIEFQQIITLLQKGIAIHHAGMIPVFREMIELLFSKGYIKLLFATETFSIGINMPAKTTIFIDMNKFDGNNKRYLQSHEYTQMAGRAGRRGIDTVGNVIHLNNLFTCDSLALSKIMNGMPQVLTSQFKFNYNLLLNNINSGNVDYHSHSTHSLYQQELNEQVNGINYKINTLKVEINDMESAFKTCNLNIANAEKYLILSKQRTTAVNKKRKEIDRQLQTLITENKNIESDSQRISKLFDKKNSINKLTEEKEQIYNYIDNNINKVITLLENENFITSNNNCKELTYKGHIASFLREIHCIVFANIIINKQLSNFNTSELVGIFSCFTNISVVEEFKYNTPSSTNEHINKQVAQITELYNNQLFIEQTNMINTGIDYDINYDIIDICINWCNCTNDIECKNIIQNMTQEKGIFLGEFVKALLKINTICSELEKIAEYIGDIEFLQKMKSIPSLTLKYVATNQSLYI